MTNSNNLSSSAVLPKPHESIPMMFRAQIGGRCQPQRVVDNRHTDEPQDAERWTEEWTDRAYPQAPEFGTQVQRRDYRLSWRFVTNGGQDDGIIRPVIGARGWPFYPGSSMKGLFRKACTPDQAKRYCGDRNKLDPGIISLRFHGGYPVDGSWQDQLLDIIHPQQDRQVKQEKKTSAFAQISLYKPTLKFGISCDRSLPLDEWETIWSIWEKALGSGLGCRVSSGYGQVAGLTGDVLYKAKLKGQGQAAKLLDQTGEFRPNIFRAALRGHALRIFGGLTEARTAERLVDELFGSVQGKGHVGLLSMAFEDSALTLDSFGSGSYAQPTYRVEGELRWLLARSIGDEEREVLKLLVQKLLQFGMVLGGFGKSWRRVDHRLCYESYYEGAKPKPLIGCHWQWDRADARELGRNNPIKRGVEDVGSFLDEVREVARRWMALQPGVRLTGGTDWREAWHPGNVQVWGRLSEGMEDCEAVGWLHGAYQKADRALRRDAGSIYQSSVTGKLGTIGHLWHRMYPWLRVVKDPKNDGKPKILTMGGQCFELLTLFPDGSGEMEDFLTFLQGNPAGFQCLWGGE
jgi:CRISPR-associated protein Cmr6